MDVRASAYPVEQMPSLTVSDAESSQRQQGRVRSLFEIEQPAQG